MRSGAPAQRFAAALWASPGQYKPGLRTASRCPVAPPRVGANRRHADPTAMKIDFCDLCNESVPLSDLEAGRAVRVKGRVV